jgi:hypothetical protein
VFLRVKLHGPRAMSTERPPMPFRRASVAIQRHENAATATAKRSINQRHAVRSDRAALRCAALGVAKAARAAHSEAGASPAERRT